MKKKQTFESLNKKSIIVIVIAAIITIVVCTWPMKLCPIWNGEIPRHRNQYEILTNNILEGHLYMDYGKVDDRLLNMENPYSPKERKNEGLVAGESYQWDHAFYKGKYYMYFGVAPVFLTFIPYRIITGHNLTTYHATQLYTALFIIGVFSLFYLICRILYKKTKVSTYIFCSIAFSIMSVWYCVAAPALYCTAISAGLCMAIWSMVFFFKAVYGKQSENRSILYAFIGSLFGALTFACRPPMGFINILVIPMLIKFIKDHKLTKKLFGKLFVAALPYFIIGGLLMTYNYVRFENPFEFGQTYQLTLEDQTLYKDPKYKYRRSKILNGIQQNFFDTGSVQEEFPYVVPKGIFMNFPILLLSILLVFSENIRKKIKEKGIAPLFWTLFFLPLLVTVIDLANSPGAWQRYMMDEIYLITIITFILIVTWYEIASDKNKKWITILINIWCIWMIIKCALLFSVPFDWNYAQYYPDKIPKLVKKITFGFIK